ncbi:MAG: AAA family ATPase [Deltaproteobacteria bacterium]|nr:AAA family ATPase [Deltaproteobacteria bacterium]
MAQHFSEVEQESEGGQSRFGGLGFFKSGAPSQGAVESTCTLPRLLDRLQVAESCRLAAEHLLGNVRLVGSSQEAFTFFAGETTSSDLVLVTPAGEVITAFSFQAFCHEGGAVQLKSKAAELEESCHRHEQGEAEINRAREELSSQIRELEKEESELRQQEQLRQAEVRQLGNALGEIRGGLKAEQEGLRRMEDDIAKVSAQIEDARRRIEAYSVEEAKIEDEVAAMRPEQEEELQQEIARLSKEYQQLDELRKAGREKLSSCAEALQKTRVELDKLRERLSGLHLDRQKLELERDSLVERIQSEYGEEACALIQAKAVEGASISPAERERFHEEVRRLKARILREGDVDPDSISRLEEEQARLDDLVRQKEDLEEASLTLKRTIEKLSETSLRRFMATFEAVRANFANLVPRLFGGGRGALALVDPQNPLETGLEIIARPPGKKLRSIELLSGGEKALCAAALIFAMFLERPSPLCVLDEVDAPLDDANLVRFLGLVKELSAKTQFIMVTHNKQSMAISDNLIGITMQEPGASKVLSVSLQEACAQVA